MDCHVYAPVEEADKKVGLGSGVGCHARLCLLGRRADGLMRRAPLSVFLPHCLSLSHAMRSFVRVLQEQEQGLKKQRQAKKQARKAQQGGGK